MKNDIKENQRTAIFNLIDRLSSPSYIAESLKSCGFSFKKRFGQHFLINRNLLERLVEWSELGENDVVIEVGPGIGVLTVYLSLYSKQVISIEIDGGFYRYLSNLLSEYGIKNVELLNADFMEICRGKVGGLDLIQGANKMVSNFPYSISNRAILETILYLDNVQLIVGMVQHESAERISARPGTKDYSVLSVIVQIASEIEVLKKSISPGNFFPQPAVRSAVIRLVKKKKIDRNTLIGFADFVKTAFSQRRKGIIKNILAGFYVDEDKLKKAIVKVSGRINTRAEELPPQVLFTLYSELRGILDKRN